MASNWQQGYRDQTLYKDLSTSSSEPVQTKRSDGKQISFDEQLQRKENNLSSILSPKIDFHANRGSSAPAINRQVGSNRYLHSFSINLPCFSIQIIHTSEKAMFNLRQPQNAQT